MAATETQLQRQCKDLLQVLKLRQEELKDFIPFSATPYGQDITTNIYNRRSDLKPEYARDKLQSVVKFSEPTQETVRRRSRDEDVFERTKTSLGQEGYTEMPRYGRSMSDSLRMREREDGEGYHGDGPPTSAYTTDDNVGSRESYSSRYTTTPRTRRRRDLIDRNVKVDTRLEPGRLDDLDTYDHLNFSYSQVKDDDMTFLKSALGQSPEELFHEVADSRMNEQWANERSWTAEDRRDGNRDFPRVTEANTERSWEYEKWREERAKNLGVYPKRMPEKAPESYSTVPTAAVDSELTYAKQLADEGNDKQLASFVKDAMTRPKSILTNNESSLSRSRSKSSSRVGFRTSADSSSMIRRETEKKMLGYDWIAALLDNEQAVMDESEGFFEELKEFRRINREECSNQVYMEGPLSLGESREPSPVVEAISESKVKPYMVNERLFTVPIKKSLLGDFEGKNEEEEGEREKKKEPTREEPRFVRVSIPRSTLESPHRFRPHRRNSFDPTDSCGLREHCLLGWNNSRPAMIPAASTVGISDASGGIKTKNSTTLADAERLASAYDWGFPPSTTHRPDLFPSWRKNYQDSVMNLSTANTTRAFTTSSLPIESESLRKTTTDLLNSTYSMMYEMQRLKKERELNPQTAAKGVA